MITKLITCSSCEITKHLRKYSGNSLQVVTKALEDAGATQLSNIKSYSKYKGVSALAVKYLYNLNTSNVILKAEFENEQEIEDLKVFLALADLNLDFYNPITPDDIQKYKKAYETCLTSINSRLKPILTYNLVKSINPRKAVEYTESDIDEITQALKDMRKIKIRSPREYAIAEGDLVKCAKRDYSHIMKLESYSFGEIKKFTNELSSLFEIK